MPYTFKSSANIKRNIKEVFNSTCKDRLQSKFTIKQFQTQKGRYCYFDATTQQSKTVDLNIPLLSYQNKENIAKVKLAQNQLTISFVQNNFAKIELYNILGHTVKSFFSNFSNSEITFNLNELNLPTQVFATEDLLEDKDKGEDLYADSAYTGEKQEEVLSKKELINRVHEKGYKNKSLTDRQKANNKIKSQIRVRVEHIFGFMENSMNGMDIRSIGFKRANAIIGLSNLVYNMFRKIQLQTSPAIG